MKIVYLISGSYSREGFCENVVQELKKDLRKNFSLAFIPTKFNEIDRNVERCNKIVGWFNEQGVEFKEVKVIDDSISNAESKEYIKNCDVVFLTGGDTLKQIEGIRKKDIKEELKNKNILIGMSAGSINLAERVVIAKDVDDDIPETMVYEGVGATNINIEPHCEFDDKEHWNDLLEASKINKIYCMKDNCAIIIKNKETSILGNYCILENGKIIFSNIEGIN